MAYKKKKSNSEAEAIRQFLDSKYYEKIKNRSKSIKNDPLFQKEWKALREKHPRPKNDKEYVAYVSKVARDRQASGAKNAVFFKEWRDFCDRWDIDYSKLCMGRVVAKGTIETGTLGETGEPYLKAISKDATRQDMQDNSAFCMAIKKHRFGENLPSQGRKQSQLVTTRNAKIIKQYNSRIKRGEKKGAVRWSLSAKYGISERQVRQILLHGR